MENTKRNSKRWRDHLAPFSPNERSDYIWFFLYVGLKSWIRNPGTHICTVEKSPQWILAETCTGAFWDDTKFSVNLYSGEYHQRKMRLHPPLILQGVRDPKGPRVLPWRWTKWFNLPAGYPERHSHGKPGCQLNLSVLKWITICLLSGGLRGTGMVNTGHFP